MIEGVWALFLAFLCFLVPMAVPLFAQRWRTFVIVLAVAALFFSWLTVEMPVAGTIPAGIGSFLGGLMLTGFAFGAIAKFVTLVGKRATPVAVEGYPSSGPNGPPSPARGEGDLRDRATSPSPLAGEGAQRADEE